MGNAHNCQHESMTITDISEAKSLDNYFYTTGLMNCHICSQKFPAIQFLNKKEMLTPWVLDYENKSNCRHKHMVEFVPLRKVNGTTGCCLKCKTIREGKCNGYPVVVDGKVTVILLSKISWNTD